MMCCFIFGAAHAQFGNVKKGDIIDINGVKAIVFTINEDGHGSAMCVKALRGLNNAWCNDRKSANEVATYNETNGMENTLAVYEYVKSNHISLSKFPVFEWCHSLGEGWYIPSVKQMETFVNFLLGNEQDYDWDNDDEYGLDTESITTKSINESMMEAGGVPFISSVPNGYTSGVYTSTKNAKEKIYVYDMNKAKNVWRFRQIAPMSLGKYTIGRAFYDF